MVDRCVMCGEIIPEGRQICPLCEKGKTPKMVNEKLTVKFHSEVCDADSCVCDACHNIGRVIKLKLPITKYFGGKKLSTNYSPYWLCFNCREKLTDALIWGDEDGK